MTLAPASLRAAQAPLAAALLLFAVQPSRAEGLPEWQPVAPTEDAACGLAAEADLIGHPRVNELSIRVPASAASRVVADELQASFDGAPAHVVVRTSRAAEGERQRDFGWVFPNKGAFKKARQLQIRLPIRRGPQTCSVTREFRRVAESSTASSAPYVVWDLYAGAGTGLLATGDVERAREVLYGGVALYPWPRHGAFADVIAEARDDQSLRVAGGRAATSRLRQLSVSAGYAYDWLLSPRLSVGYRLGAGVSHYRWGSGSSVELSTTSWLLAERMSADYLLSPIATASSSANPSVGVCFHHHYRGGGELGGVDLSGHDIGALLVLRLSGP